MSDQVYQQHIAGMLALIELYGVVDAVRVVAEALELKLNNDGLFTKERIKMEISLKKINGLYREIEKL